MPHVLRLSAQNEVSQEQRLQTRDLQFPWWSRITHSRIIFIEIVSPVLPRYQNKKCAKLFLGWPSYIYSRVFESNLLEGIFIPLVFTTERSKHSLSTCFLLEITGYYKIMIRISCNYMRSPLMKNTEYLNDFLYISACIG